MERRVKELRITWEAVAERSGYSTTLFRNIRKDFEGTNVTDEVARAIDDALDWEHGSTLAVLEGGEATPLPAHAAGSPTSLVELLASWARELRQSDYAQLAEDVLHLPREDVNDLPKSLVEVLARWQTVLRRTEYPQLARDVIMSYQAGYKEGMRQQAADTSAP